MDLGWGRGGLLGGGSSVVALGGDLVPQGSPKDLDIFWKRLLFFSFFLFPPGSFLGFFSWGVFLGVVAGRGVWLLVITGSLPESLLFSQFFKCFDGRGFL